MNPSNTLKKAALRYKHIIIESNPSSEFMDELIHHAQVNLLVTFQDTGLKLKLLNSLFAGRHVVVNPMMLAGSGLDALCYIAGTPEKMIEVCRRLMDTPFTACTLEKRSEKLFPFFSDKYQAERLIGMIRF